jgi:hypothetical protein
MKNGLRWSVALMLALAACGREENRKGEPDTATRPTATTTPVAPPAQAAAGDCPATGMWAPCSLEKRLRRSGFVVTKLDSLAPSRPGFKVRPIVYKLGTGRLEVFVYEDAAAMERDIAGIDTVTVSPPGTTSVWATGAGLVRNGNLAAVHTGQSPRQAERLMLAITAGAPSGG